MKKIYFPNPGIGFNINDFEDENLSLGAKGLMAMFYFMPELSIVFDDIPWMVDEIVLHCDAGRIEIECAIKELVKIGFLRHE